MFREPEKWKLTIGNFAEHETHGKKVLTVLYTPTVQ